MVGHVYKECHVNLPLTGLTLFCSSSKINNKKINFPFSAHIGFEVYEGYYIWYQSIKLQRLGLMDSSTCRYDVNYVISL